MARLNKLAILLIFFATYALGQSSLHISEQHFKDQMMNGINARRANGCQCGNTLMKPVSPLTWNVQLAYAAREHARDMYGKNYFSHQSKDGRTLHDRLLKAGYQDKGYQSYAIGENIAFNQQTIDEVLNGWFKSKEHCKNLMNPAFTEIGVAEYQKYWVQDFGGRVKFGL